MGEACHQLWLGGLVRIMALNAVCGSKWLSLVCLDQRGIFYIVAAEAEFGYAFSEMEGEFSFALFADLVRDMAAVAAHIEGGMAAAFLRNVQALCVAIKA